MAAAVLAILDGQNILTALTDTFMSGASTYVKNFFLLFCVSALFGKVMEETGAAAAIAKWLTKLLGEKFAILGVFFAGMFINLWRYFSTGYRVYHVSDCTGGI